MRRLLLLGLFLFPPVLLRGEIITEYDDQDSQGYWVFAPYQILAVQYVFEEPRQLYQIQFQFWGTENLRVWISRQTAPDSLFYQDLEDTTKIISEVGDIPVTENQLDRWLTYDLPEAKTVQGKIWVVCRLTDYGPGEANLPGLAIRGQDTPPRTSWVKVTETEEPGEWGPLGSNMACAVVVDEYLGIGGEEEKKIPRAYSLGQNYPNPFNPRTVIPFSLSVRTFLTLKIFNLLGQEVVRLAEKEFGPGEYHVVWDGTNPQGRKISSGIYFYNLASKEGSITKKMLVAH